MNIINIMPKQNHPAYNKFWNDTIWGKKGKKIPSDDGVWKIWKSKTEPKTKIYIRYKREKQQTINIIDDNYAVWNCEGYSYKQFFKIIFKKGGRFSSSSESISPVSSVPENIEEEAKTVGRAHSTSAEGVAPMKAYYKRIYNI